MVGLAGVTVALGLDVLLVFELVSGVEFVESDVVGSKSGVEGSESGVVESKSGVVKSDFGDSELGVVGLGSFVELL